MEDHCFLCRIDITFGSSKAKRRRIYGKAAEETKNSLNNWCKEEFGYNLSEVVGEHSYICNKCYTTINEIEKAAAKKRELLQQLRGCIFVLSAR